MRPGSADATALAWNRSSFLRLLAAATLFGLTAAATAAPPDTAGQMLHSAEAQARAQHKNVLVDFSASWCVNCRLFDRFWNDPAMHPILDKAFVRLTLDAGESSADTVHHDTPGAMALMTKLGGPNVGLPFVAILSPDGETVSTTLRDIQGSPADRNIGYPYLPVEVDWFMHMLAESAPSLTPQETAAVHAWLTQHGQH